MRELLVLTDAIDFGSGATREMIAGVEAQPGFRFPKDYVDFVMVRNGGEGPVGPEGFARFVDVEGLAGENESLSDLDHLEGFVVFGGNGAGELFAFDAHGDVHILPMVGGPADAIPQGTFGDLLRRLANGTAFDRPG